MSPLSSQPSFNFSITSCSVQVSIVEEYHLQTDRIAQADENVFLTSQYHQEDEERAWLMS